MSTSKCRLTMALWGIIGLMIVIPEVSSYYCDLRHQPTLECVPTAAELEAFASNVQGKLIVVGTGEICKNMPGDFTPGAPQYASYIKYFCYSNAVCAPDLRMPAPDAPISEWTEWETLSSSLSPPNCTNSLNVNFWNTDEDQFPAFIFVPESEGDVTSAISFITAHQLRMSIISTGHDQYGGRNSGRNSFQISLHKLKRVTVNPTTSSVSVQTGATFGEITKEVFSSGFAVSRGWDLSVGACGWSLGGGHGPYGPFLGFGVDNLLSVRIVIADGSIIIASNTSNPDLFWSLRGAGGGNLGVITEMTIRLHPQPESVDSIMGIYSVGRKDMTTLLTTLHGLYVETFQQWSLLYIVGPPESVPLRSVQVVALRWEKRGMSPDELYIKLNAGPKITSKRLDDATLPEWETWMQPSSDIPIPFASPIAGTMVHKAGMTDPDLINIIVSGLFDYNSPLTIMHPIAGPTSLDGHDYPDSGLSQAFRHGLGWLAVLAPSGVAGVAREALVGYSKLMGQLRELGGGGVYPNEACARSYINGSLEQEYWHADWKVDFWGSKYDQHLKIKNKWDPDFVFYCEQCVGWNLISPVHTTPDRFQ